MGTTSTTPHCPGIEVGIDLTCIHCGRAVAEYPSFLDPTVVVWQHRRGAARGQVERMRGDAHATGVRLRLSEDRVTELEAENTDLRARLAAIGADAFDRIETKLDTLLSRPAGVTEWRPDHRRAADGGVPVREQRRAMRG